MNEIETPAGSHGGFQFGLLTMFALTTGLAVALGLIRWHPAVGTLSAIVLVGGGWSWGAYRSDRRRLAYYLLTPVLGVVAYLLLSLPLSPATFFLLWGDFGRPHWPRLPEMLSMCAAAAVTATLLRRRIRRPTTGSGAGLSALAAYLGTLAYAWLFFLGLTLGSAMFQGYGFGPGDAVSFGVMLIPMLIICPVVTTFSLHVAWPMAFLFVRLLREVDPLERDLSESQREVVEAIRALGTRPPARHRRVADRDVAEYLDRDPNAIHADLERLVQLRAIDESIFYGYRLFP